MVASPVPGAAALELAGVADCLAAEMSLVSWYFLLQVVYVGVGVAGKQTLKE